MAADIEVVRSVAMPVAATRRAGVSERRLIGPAQSPWQNLVLVDFVDGAEVEWHRISPSESLFIIQGEFEVETATGVKRLEPGDLCYFPPGSSHGLRCSRGPAQMLVVFAPAADGSPPGAG